MPELDALQRKNNSLVLHNDAVVSAVVRFGQVLAQQLLIFQLMVRLEKKLNLHRV